MITIVDFGLGNIMSVQNMILHVGGKCCIASKPEQIKAADKLVLPGVGAFDSGMIALKERGLIEALIDTVLVRKKIVLGICLGMQLLTRQSEEGEMPGLGWIDAEVKRFNFAEGSKYKIPHMGWNTITVCKKNPLLNEEGEQRFYFVHSFKVFCRQGENVLALSNYGDNFVAAFSNDNIFGVQFHPEKSHRFGMALLKRFMEL